MLFFFQKKWKDAQQWIRDFFSASSQSILSKKGVAQPICQMLCVDDDKSFCFFMQQLAASFGIQMDVAHSIQQAKGAIETQQNYQSFIIDGHLPDGSGFELVAWIREKKDITLPIVFISRIYQDATSFRLLRESLKVNFVLEKPIRSNEVHHLFVQLSQLMSLQSTAQEPFPPELLQDLKATYQKTIPDKIERLEKMILDVQRNPSIDTLQVLKGEVHKIAGSAGSYGYMAVSELCKNLEEDLAKQIKGAKENQFNPAWIETLDDFFTQVKLHFQMKIPEFEFQTSFKTGFLPTIYVVDDDEKFLKDITQSIQGSPFEILTESHPDNAIHTVLAADFYPEILLFDAHYSTSTLTGYELIKAFYQNNDELTNIIALMTDTHSIESQVEALQQGIPLIIAKPFLPSLIVPLMEQIPFRALPLPFKVFVIDDDVDICQYILKILKFTGLQVRAFSDVSNLEIEIQNENPDLILLDINLVDLSGVSIIQRLRNDWKYSSLLVGMLSPTQQETHLLQKCYDANINDLLFKPLERGVLQRKVVVLLKRKAEEKVSAKQDETLKWATLPTFKRYLQELGNGLRRAFSKTLVLFEIDGLSDLSSKEKNKVLEFISEALEDLLRKYESATYLSHGRFALIFQGYDTHFVQLFMHHFLQRIHKDLQNDVMEKPCSIYEVLVPLSDEEKNVLQRAEDLLDQGKSARKSINLMVEPSFEALKAVFIFHDDGESSDKLARLFKGHGFKVDFSNTMENLPQFTHPLPLFIFTGSFAEAKGLHVLKKLIGQYHNQIPILYLPSLSNIEYLQRLLTEVHYFESPFSLVIFLAEGAS